jgi:hypothetical protein
MFGQVPTGLRLGKDLSFVDEEPIIGFGDFICSSQASMM